MYRFNFLNKINQEKLENKKRNKFIVMIFISSTCCLFLLLSIMVIQSLNIGSGNKEARDFQDRITKKSAAFRNKDFFRYNNIENVYNLSLKRRSITSILNAIESSLDSSLIITNLIISDNAIDIRFISRSSASKSQLMSRMNILKSQINEKLVNVNYVDEKKPLNLTRGPDIRSSFEEFQYWVFDFAGEFKNNVPEKKKAASSKPESDSKVN